jgi:four helix bundle protein
MLNCPLVSGMADLFRVLAAARAVADEVNHLLRNPELALIHREQLRKSAEAIPANIREAMGRDVGPDRNKSYRVARGEAEETDEHLRANFADDRLAAPVYWRLHNRLKVIVRMLDSLMSHPAA